MVYGHLRTQLGVFGGNFPARLPVLLLIVPATKKGRLRQSKIAFNTKFNGGFLSDIILPSGNPF